MSRDYTKVGPEGKKAPPGCYWRGPVLWAKIKVAKRQHRLTLRTDDPKVAATRRKFHKDALIRQRYYPAESAPSAEALT
jgi:integrase/recombinase XerD